MSSIEQRLLQDDAIWDDPVYRELAEEYGVEAGIAAQAFYQDRDMPKGDADRRRQQVEMRLPWVADDLRVGRYDDPELDALYSAVTRFGDGAVTAADGGDVPAGGDAWPDTVVLADDVLEGMLLDADSAAFQAVDEADTAYIRDMVHDAVRSAYGPGKTITLYRMLTEVTTPISQSAGDDGGVLAVAADWDAAVASGDPALLERDDAAVDVFSPRDLAGSVAARAEQEAAAEASADTIDDLAAELGDYFAAHGMQEIVDDQEEEFLSEKYLYSGNDHDQGTVAEADGVFLDSCVFKDLGTPRIWRRREYLAGAYQEGGTGMSVANDVYQIRPDDTHVPLLRHLLSRWAAFDEQVATVGYVQGRNDEQGTVRFTVPPFIDQVDLRDTKLPAAELRWAQQHDMLGDMKIMEYARRHNLNTVTDDADLAIIAQERDRYSDVSVLPVDTAHDIYAAATPE